MLVQRAESLGVHLNWRAKETLSDRHSSARWIIGADGQNSQVRHTAGLGVMARESCRFGFSRHYWYPPWTDHVEVYWGDGCQIYITPVSPEEIDVALLSCDAHLRLDHALPRFPELHEKLRHATPASRDRGGMTCSRTLKRVFNGRVVLVGDASGSVDAITGEGLSLAFHHAIRLAEALQAEDLMFYKCEHRRLARRPALVARTLLALERSAALRRYVFQFMAWRPRIFSTLLNLGFFPA
jgi:2-polyprenyl-6-methoxyphenol hydroxylase-like FAD-dependent oxidoreductase